MRGIAEEIAPLARPPQQGTAPHTQIHHYLRRALENAQDVIVIGLMLLLLAIALRALWTLFQMAFLQDHQSSVILSQIIYILVLTEVYRTLIFYLREHRVAVALIVETAIVSLLSSVILSVPHPEWGATLATGGLLLVLGALLALDRWFSRSRNDVSDSSVH